MAALISSLFALFQYFGWAIWLWPIVSNANLGEAFANLRQRNQFATLTNIGMVGLVFCYLKSSRSATQASLALQSKIPWRYVMAVALLATANAASTSRTGLLQLIGLVAAGFMTARNKRIANGEVVRFFCLVALISYLAASIALPLIIGLDSQASGIFARFQDKAFACQSRITLWSNVIYQIAQKPWMGWGWGELDYAHFITLYPGNRFCDILDNAHNLPLQIAVELGLPFAFAFCIATIWLVMREKPWREQDPMRQLAWIILILIGLHSMLEYPLWYGPFQMTSVLCLGILWRIPASWRVQNSNKNTLQAMSPTLSKAMVVTALLVITGCTYAAWDYWRISQIYMVPTQRAPAYQEDTLSKIQSSWLFKNQVRFAELNVTPLTKDNASQMNAFAKEMLHVSPEPSVVRKLIESATLLGHDDEAAFYLQRFKAAFPDAKL